MKFLDTAIPRHATLAISILMITISAVNAVQRSTAWVTVSLFVHSHGDLALNSFFCSDQCVASDKDGDLVCIPPTSS